MGEAEAGPSQDDGVEIQSPEDFDTIMDDQPETQTTTLARNALIWNKRGYNNDDSSDEDGSGYSSSGELLVDSDEEDDLDHNLPPWQMGLTAGEVIEEDFQAEAVAQGW